MNHKFRPAVVDSIDDWLELSLLEQVAVSYEGSDWFTSMDVAERFGLTQKRAQNVTNGIWNHDGRKSCKYEFEYIPGSPRRGRFYKAAKVKVLRVNHFGNKGNTEKRNKQKKKSVTSILNKVWR